jgi:hypothetical protein
VQAESAERGLEVSRLVQSAVEAATWEMIAPDFSFCSLKTNEQIDVRQQN